LRDAHNAQYPPTEKQEDQPDHCGSGNSDVDHIVALFRSHTVTETDNYGDIAQCIDNYKEGEKRQHKIMEKITHVSLPNRFDLSGLNYQILLL
jgi:hypothetical protein